MKSIKTLFILLIALTVATTASAYNFTKDLEFGAEGNDVVELQQMLSAAGYLEMPADAQYGYFGKATELAVAKWQIANNIAPISGIFGPKSRSLMNISKAIEQPMSADTTNYVEDYVGIPERSQYLNKNQYNWFSEKLISAGYVPEKLGEKILEPLRKMTKPEIMSWALVLQQNGRITQNLYRQIKSTLLGGGGTQFRLTTPNNGESYQLASIIGNTLSGQENSVYIINWEGGSMDVSPRDEIKAFLEKKVGSEYVTIGRIPALAYGSIHSLAGYIAPKNCTTTYFHEGGNWDNSCMNANKYQIVEPGQYYVRLLDTITGLSDRSDKPITFTYGQPGGGSYGNYFFTRDLTLGATGTDVVALQDIMISFSLLNMPVGYNKGYFGTKLQEAVAKWQKSVGISPANGYFGPVDRAYISAKQGREDIRIPKITMVRAKAQEDYTVNVGEAGVIEGSNLVYAGKDTRVYIEGKEAKVIQYSSNVVYFMVPSMTAGTYKLYVETTGGRSNSVKISVYDSSSTPSVSYVQSPAGDKNVLYPGERSTVYGKNLNSDRIRVFLSGKAMGEEINTFAPSENSISFMVPNDIPEQKFELFLEMNGVKSNSITVYFESKMEIMPPYVPYEPIYPGTIYYSSKADCESGTGYVCEEYTYESPQGCLAIGPMCEKPEWRTAWRPTSVKIAPVVTPVKLTPAQICAAVQKPTTSTCVKTYPIFKGTERMTGYMYEGFKYDISYNKYANSAGAVCRDTCTAKAY